MSKYNKCVCGFLKQRENYKHDVDNFNDFLKMKYGYDVDDDMMDRMIMTVDTDLIIESLQYIISSTSKYTKKTTAMRYMSVIGQLFEYISYKDNIMVANMRMDMQTSPMEESKYVARLTEYINGCKELQDKAESEPLDQESAEFLNDWANGQLEYSRGWNNDLGYRKAMAALAIKFILLYGLTYRELRKLNWGNYLEKSGEFIINGFKLRLPVTLIIHLNEWKRFNEDNGTLGEFVFVDFEGVPWGKITSASRLPDYISTVIGKTSLTSVAKYGISQMIIAGINTEIIRRISGASDRIIQSCVRVDGDKLIKDVNSKISTVEMYDRI